MGLVGIFLCNRSDLCGSAPRKARQSKTAEPFNASLQPTGGVPIPGGSNRIAGL